MARFPAPGLNTEATCRFNAAGLPATGCRADSARPSALGLLRRRLVAADRPPSDLGTGTVHGLTVHHPGYPSTCTPAASPGASLNSALPVLTVGATDSQGAVPSGPRPPPPAPRCLPRHSLRGLVSKTPHPGNRERMFICRTPSSQLPHMLRCFWAARACWPRRQREGKTAGSFPATNAMCRPGRTEGELGRLGIMSPLPILPRFMSLAVAASRPGTIQPSNPHRARLQTEGRPAG